MNQITVPKTELVKAMRQNLEKHRQVFEAAMDGYQKAAGDWLAERLTDARAGKLRDPLVYREPIPEDHTADYERVLAMLAMTVDETIELSENDFARYVQDEWGWKREWVATASNYTAV